MSSRTKCCAAQRRPRPGEAGERSRGREEKATTMTSRTFVAGAARAARAIAAMLLVALVPTRLPAQTPWNAQYFPNLELTTHRGERVRFYDWDAAKGEVRWMCSFDTSEDDIDAFVAGIRDELHQA